LKAALSAKHLSQEKQEEGHGGQEQSCLKGVSHS